MRQSTINHPLACHAGVYSITNLDTGKVYIGATCRSFRSRWVQHLNDLRINTHGNSVLQADWNVACGLRLAFDVVEIVGPDELRQREQAAIDDHVGRGVSLYNKNQAYREPLDVYTDDELFARLYDLLPDPV